jgi:DNA-binding transcriptional MerR regulator
MPAPTSLEEYLTVKAAAAFLGVCPSTLRNWDRAGKLRPHRHPINRYRLYRRAELEAVLRCAAGEDHRDD